MKFEKFCILSNAAGEYVALVLIRTIATVVATLPAWTVWGGFNYLFLY